ncbi:hypothetical protein F6455_05300 [Proteobacteria bacterium 005FR1]|nr:hypothetical protein [Proteobacteria bacterium 005FR1]
MDVSLTLLTLAAVLGTLIATRVSADLVLMAALAFLLIAGVLATNLMVYGPGRYQFTNYLRVGAPLSALVGVIAVPLIPFVWQF